MSTREQQRSKYWPTAKAYALDLPAGDPNRMTEPRPGDWALHKSNQLDAREVARVEGRFFWIFIDEDEAGPYRRENYTFTRRSSAAGGQS